MYEPELLKSKELITIKPSRELNFLPINKRYVSSLNIYNKSDHPIIFRVKTTAARSYVVNPHTDIILPRRSSEVKFIMPYNDKVRERAEDKFLVQAIIYAEEDLSLNQERMYEVFVELSKKVSKKEIQSFKLKVHFEINPIIEEEGSDKATPLKTPFFPFFDSNKDEELSELNIDAGVESDEEKARTRKRFDFKAQTVSPKSLFSQEETSKGRGSMTNLKEVENNINHTEPKKRLVFKVKKNSTLIPDLISKSPSRTSVHLQENRTPEKGNVNRELYSNFELAATSQIGGLSPFTSPPRSFADQSQGDFSMKSDISPMNDAKRMLIYKSKYESLKNKWQLQQNQLSKLMEEQGEYMDEMKKTKVMLGSETNIGNILGDNTVVQKKGEKKRSVELWQLMMISVVFLILGSLLR